MNRKTLAECIPSVKGKVLVDILNQLLKRDNRLPFINMIVSIPDKVDGPWIATLTDSHYSRGDTFGQFRIWFDFPNYIREDHVDSAGYGIAFSAEYFKAANSRDAIFSRYFDSSEYHKERPMEIPTNCLNLNNVLIVTPSEITRELESELKSRLARSNSIEGIWTEETKDWFKETDK